MPMSPEQLQALLEMSGSDIGGLEDEQARQVALANAMRGQMTSARRGDTGQNIANAAYGISGALDDRSARLGTPAISGAKKSTFAKIIAGLSGKKALEESEQLGMGSH